MPVLRDRAATRESEGTVADQKGGADVIFDQEGNRIAGATIMAVVANRQDQRGRDYRLPTKNDYMGVWRAQAGIGEILCDWERAGQLGLSPVPDEAISLNEIRRISVPIYGMAVWADMFTAR